jgi:hypothetical protein
LNAFAITTLSRICASEPPPCSNWPTAFRLDSSPFPACSRSATPKPSAPGDDSTWLKVLADWPSNLDADASPLFPPQHPDAQSAKEEISHIISREPRQFDLNRSRWTLATVQQVCQWLRERSLSSIHRLLDKLEIALKRGRWHIHSPDDDYTAKLALIKTCRELAERDPEHYVLLYEDEFTYYRQPSLSRDYAPRGLAQPRAELSHRSNTITRVIGVLDALTGRVVYEQASRTDVRLIVRFYERVCQLYPGVRVFIVQDNWPVHFHPDVMAALEPQEVNPFGWRRPPNWPTEPSKKARRLNLPLQLIVLPTYASWCNPIEKLWRWLKAEVLHHHRLAENLPGLRQQVGDFLASFSAGSQPLLRYVGLLHPT